MIQWLISGRSLWPLGTLIAVRILMSSSLMESARWAQCLPLHSSSGFIPLLLNLNGCCLGKSSLLYFFATGVFPNEFLPGLFETYVADLVLDGRQGEIALWDTINQEDYERLRPLWYSNSHVILICYAIDIPGSLTSVIERASSDTTSSIFFMV